MTASNASSRASLYDLFKLLIAIILLLLFLCLFIWMKPTGGTPPDKVITATSTVVEPTETLPATQTAVPASSTSALLTATLVSTATSLPTDTPQPTLTPTPLPSLTDTPVPETLPSPIVEIPAEPEVCEAIARSQLQVGMQAVIQRHLNFRSSPGIMNNWLRTNIPGTQVEIVGGPECTRYEKGGAYLWWQIKLPNGLIGWSAEASAFGTFYFMEPSP